MQTSSYITLLLTTGFSYCHLALGWLSWAQPDVAGKELGGLWGMGGVRVAERSPNEVQPQSVPPQQLGPSGGQECPLTGGASVQ